MRKNVNENLMQINSDVSRHSHQSSLFIVLTNRSAGITRSRNDLLNPFQALSKPWYFYPSNFSLFISSQADILLFVFSSHNLRILTVFLITSFHFSSFALSSIIFIRVPFSSRHLKVLLQSHISAASSSFFFCLFIIHDFYYHFITRI